MVGQKFVLLVAAKYSVAAVFLNTSMCSLAS